MAPEAVYFHSAHPDVVGDRYWRADANGATPLDTQGVISTNSYLAAEIYQGDLWATDGRRVVRVPAGSTTGEVVLNGGWDYELDRLYAAGDNLYLVDRHMVAMEPIQDVLWRYNAATKVLERIGKYGAIDTLAAMGDSLYFSDTYGEPANQATRLLRLLQTAKTPSVVSVMATGGDNVARQYGGSRQPGLSARLAQRL